MTYQFRFREEPFGLNSALDNAEELLSTDFAETWQGEVSRKSPDYVRWVQRSLNQILGLRLAVDGGSRFMLSKPLHPFGKKRTRKAQGSVLETSASTVVDQCGAINHIRKVSM
ncbi:MAG: hypothetical protein M3495_09490 [Pseudomonadota bacterium]|nr:hypothetical protein [Pseudomonadota bacterium]